MLHMNEKLGEVLRSFASISAEAAKQNIGMVIRVVSDDTCDDIDPDEYDPDAMVKQIIVRPNNKCGIVSIVISV